MILAHPNYPVRLLRRYANDLQKQAKRACAATGMRSGVAWQLLTDSSPLTDTLELQGGCREFGLEALEDLLHMARTALKLKVPAAAFHSLLSHYRQEERALDSLAGDAKDKVLNLIAANFFRYQLARNDPGSCLLEQLAEAAQLIERRLEIGLVGATEVGKESVEFQALVGADLCEKLEGR